MWTETMKSTGVDDQIKSGKLKIFEKEQRVK